MNLDVLLSRAVDLGHGDEEERARITVLCPITAPTATWEMKRQHIDDVVESARTATAAMLAQKGPRFMRHSGIQYLELRS